MVRVVFLFLISLGMLNASPLHDELKNFLGQNSYIAKKKFLQLLFKDEQKFYIGNQVDMHKVINVIKENNLLPLEYRDPKELSLSFATEQNSPIVFMKMIRNSLNALGYNTPSSEKVMRDSSGFLWKINLRIASALDPALFAEELAKQKCYITQIKRYSSTNWRYNIDIQNIDIVPQKIDFNQKVTLPKPLTPYWIDVERAKTLAINSSRANSWHPYVIFYDRDLKVLDNMTKEIKSYNEQLSIPRNAKYAKISDIYTLENLRRGITVYISK